MTYLIDGHNLIPHVAGLSLDQLDDEEELLARLDTFSRQKHCQIEVFFDRGQTGNQRDIHHNRVNAHFVLPPINADTAIQSRLLGIGRMARNYIVVTSDHEVQSHARHTGARILSSPEFAALLDRIHSSIDKPKNEKSLPSNEVEEWLKLFQKGRKNNNL